jgi:hypothetical protein
MAAVTTSQYSTGESPPIKAGHREALPHLTSTCTGINTFIREKYETISGALEKSAAAHSAEPNSKAILQCLGLLFPAPIFVDA